MLSYSDIVIFILLRLNFQGGKNYFFSMNLLQYTDIKEKPGKVK